MTCLNSKTSHYPLQNHFFAKNHFLLENIIVIDAYISVCFQLPFVILPFRLINSSPREEYMSYYSPFHFWLVFNFIHLYMRQEVTYCKKDMQIRNYVDFFQNLSEVIKLDSSKSIPTKSIPNVYIIRQRRTSKYI